MCCKQTFVGDVTLWPGHGVNSGINAKFARDVTL